MFPWTPPLWLTVAFVATAIAINLMTIVSKKAITKRLNGKQNNEPYTKNTAYWTHAISSRIAIVVNSIVAIVGTPLLITGIAWLGSKSPHIFIITMCALTWIASLFFTQVFFIDTKSQDSDAQENDALIDPHDRHAINAYIGWILFNVIFDAFVWLVTNSANWKETIPH